MLYALSTVVTYIITALRAALRFAALSELAFSPKPEAALWPFLMHLNNMYITRNTTHLWEEGRKATWYS